MTDTARTDAMTAEFRGEGPADARPRAALGFEAAYDAYGPMVYRLAMV